MSSDVTDRYARRRQTDPNRRAGESLSTASASPICRLAYHGPNSNRTIADMQMDIETGPSFETRAKGLMWKRGHPYVMDNITKSLQGVQTFARTVTRYIPKKLG